ncbi:MAG: AMP-binding protein [Burkholderiales bacterium]|nr:AMP-binding protein [Burkholderiales bacterium]
MSDDDYFNELEALQRRHWPAGTPTELVYPLGEITLGEMLRLRAQQTPTKPAVIFYGHTLTYAELDAQTDRMAALLHAHGVRPGDRVAVMLGNCPQFHLAFHGILKLGAVHVPVNPLFKQDELVYELNDSGATTLLVLDALADMALAVQARTSVQRVFVTHLAELIPAEPTLPVPDSIRTPKQVPAGTTDLLPALAACTAPTPPLATDLDATAALNYTGGTTGLPKGCVHTQRDMVYTAASAATVSRGNSPDDVTLNYMAMFWIAGENAGVIYPVFNGGTLVLLARWDALAAMMAIERYRVTRAGFVVDNAVEILDHPRAGEFDLRSLKGTRVSSFVKKLNPDYRARWRALTGTTMVEAAWGMTETHTSDTFTIGLQHDDLDLKGQPVFVGLPVPGTRIKVCDWTTGAPLPLGTEGEIVVRTPSLMKGYWQQPAASAEAIRDGWFRTGDIGVFDTMGLLHFLGRRKEMLKVRGMSVFPTEIEALLGQHPAVLGSGVVGVADAQAGELPVAFVLARPGAGLTADTLTAWCREHMAGYKVPLVRIVDALPMTATGKVKKHELLPLLEADQDQRP